MIWAQATTVIDGQVCVQTIDLVEIWSSPVFPASITYKLHIILECSLLGTPAVGH